MKELVSAEQEAKSRRGSRAAYKHGAFVFTLCENTPPHGDRPFEIGHIDHTQIDLQMVGRRWGENLGKAWLTLLLDATARAILAFALTFDPPSYRSCMLVLRDCIKRHGRVPSTIVVDQGSEFDSVYFETLLAHLSVIKKSRPRQSPRFGSLLERFFGLTNTEFIHNLSGSNVPLQSPREMSATHDPRKSAVWDLKSFTKLFERFVFEVYGDKEHSALGISPNEAMRIGMARTGMRMNRLIPWTPEVRLLCLPSTPKGTAMIVSGRGVQIKYLFYFHPIMNESRFARTNVPVRYDPFDRASAFAYVDGEWRPCVSELAHVFRNRTEREIDIASMELNGRQVRTGGRRVVNAQTLAAFITEVEQQEAVLRQRLRDTEFLDTSEPPEPPYVDQTRSDEIETVNSTKATANLWATVNAPSFGVCK